jgi:hypothetical protein
MPTPEEKIALARQQMGKEMPDVADRVNVQPYGMWENLTSSPTALATTSPFTGNVYYNPKVVDNYNQPDIDAVMSHELTHSRQVLNQGPVDRGISILKNLFTNQGPYNQRSNEMEADQTMKDRALSMHLPQEGDFTLMKDKPVNGLMKVR